MALIPQNPINAPDTTIQIGSIRITVICSPDQSIANVSVRVFDGYGVAISLPRPLLPMTHAEVTAMCTEIAHAVETAAIPYLDRVLNIGTPTLT